jgi:hypothetical protein
MSGYLRLCLAGLLLTGLSTSPASSNPFTDLFNTAPEEEAVPAPAKEECLLRPGKSTAKDQHWVYRFDGNRKCWFQSEGVVAKKRLHHQLTKQRFAAAEENEDAPRKQKAVDARAELARSAPSETSRPTAPKSELVDAAPLPAAAAAARMPPPLVPKPAIDRLAPDDLTPSVDVEMLLASAPSARDTLTSFEASASTGAPPADEAADDGWEWIASCFGMVLMALGLVALVSLFASQGTIAVFRARQSHGGLMGLDLPGRWVARAVANSHKGAQGWLD